MTTVKNCQKWTNSNQQPPIHQQTQFYGVTRVVRRIYMWLSLMVESPSTRWCYLSAHNMHTVLWCPRCPV